ncbi:MAG: flagellar basal body-associated FliL family protein [Bdellovibrionota bacterium]
MADAAPPLPPGAAAPGPPKGPIFLALLNTLAILGTVGLLYYTRMLYQRPAITEAGERDRLAEAKASPLAPAKPALIKFDPFTANISPSPDAPKPADGTARQLQGKLHYVTVGFALEIRDENQKDLIDEIRPQLMDRLLQLLGHKAFQDLTSVQGRYILRTQILETANKLIASGMKSLHEDPRNRDGLISNVYLTQIVVQ